jgi:hypothetical protein
MQGHEHDAGYRYLEILILVQNFGFAASPLIEFTFNRSDGAAFCNVNLTPSDDFAWHNASGSCTGAETNLGALQVELSFSASATGGTFEVDDVSIGPSISVSGFRNLILHDVQVFNPSYVRADNTVGMGDTEADVTNPDELTRFSSSWNGPETTTGVGTEGLSWPDFLGFIRQVGATTSPWLVIPTMWNDAELTAAGAYLCAAQNSYSFPEILLGVGNEDWNTSYQAAGIPDLAAYSNVISRNFGLISSSYTAAGYFSGPLKLVATWQYVNSANVAAMQSILSDLPNLYVAVAPYFYRTDNSGDTAGNLWNDSTGEDNPATYFSPEVSSLQPDQQMITYEQNIENVQGTANSQQLYSQANSYAGGGAVGQEMIRLMDAGTRFQTLYTLGQINTEGDNGTAGRLTNPRFLLE